MFLNYLRCVTAFESTCIWDQYELIPVSMGGLFENSVLPASNEDVQFWGTPALDKPLKRLTISPPTKLGFTTNEPPKTGLWDGTTYNFSKIMMMCHECHCIPKLRPAFSSIFSWLSHGSVTIFSEKFPSISQAFPQHFPPGWPPQLRGGLPSRQWLPGGGRCRGGGRGALWLNGGWMPWFLVGGLEHEFYDFPWYMG